MSDFMQKVYSVKVSDGEVAVFWLGQAGFLFKTASGKLIAIDVYLSDCCNRYFGFKRLMPRLVEPGELAVDILIASHAHYDHFDVDSMPTLLSNPNAVLLTALDGKAECERLNLPDNQIRYMKKGDVYKEEDFRVEALDCDHGELAPEALGLLFTFGKKRVYFAGDTAFRADIFKDEKLKNVDLMIAPINGAFGNMNEEECAEAAKIICPKCVVPCHFWNFAEHGGNPGRFQSCMKEISPDIPYLLLSMGGMTII